MSKRGTRIRIFFFLVLVMFMLFHCTNAQTAPNPAFGFTFRENLKASLSVMLVAFFSALAFMGIFSLYLRHCSSSEYGSIINNRNPMAATAELCRRGFNRHLIDKCPILVYSTVKDLKMGKGALECAVCLNEFRDQDEIRLLPKCHHVFHPHCIDVWLLTHMNCPVCRARLTTSDTANIAVATPVLPSNTENNPTTTPEAGRGQEMENQQHQHVVSVSLLCNNHYEEKEEQRQSSNVTGSGVVALAAEGTVPSRESRITSDKFLRSHSTGHSLVDDRHTLRLPEHVRKQILVNHGRVRGLTRSDLVLPGAWSSKRTWYNRSNINMELWSSLSLTPPFVS